MEDGSGNITSTAANAAAIPCGHCGEQASQQCGSCKNMRYCSLECQQADWNAHKTLCKQYVSVMENGRPGERARLTILLAEEEEEPKFLWQPCEVGKRTVEMEEEDDNDDDPASAELYEARQSAVKAEVPFRDDDDATHLPQAGTGLAYSLARKKFLLLVCGRQGDGTLLAYSVRMILSSTSGSKTNKCLQRLLGPKLADVFKGDVMLYAMTKVYDSQRMVDIDTRGFTLALDALITGGGKLGKPPRKTMGVLVSTSEPFFTERPVPLHHPIFTKGKPSKVYALLGSPLLLYKQPTPTPTTSPEDSDKPLNRAAWLRLVVDPASPRFGSIPAAAKSDPSNVLVVAGKHPNGAPRFPLQAESLENMLSLVEDDMHKTLNDASMAPRERWEALQAKAAAAFCDFMGGCISGV